MARIKTHTTSTVNPASLWSWVQEIMSRDLSISGDRMSDQNKFRFYSDLHVLTSSGLDLKSTFDLLLQESDDQSTSGKMLEKVSGSIRMGSPLSDSLKSESGFTAYEVSTINIGEETGNLTRVLLDLATYFERKLKLRRDLISAFSYPVMVMVVAVGAVAFMLTFVVPVFQDLFSRMGQELPWLTKQIVTLSDFASANWWLVFIIIFLFTGIYFLLQKNAVARSRWQSFILKVPYLGSFVTKSVLARFSNSMGFLLSCNVNLLRALELSSNMVEFEPLKNSIARISKGLIAGEAMEQLLQNEPLFNNRFKAMIRVGEEVNQLPQVFQHLGNQYQNDIERETKSLSSFIEPVMIILVGLMVGVILVAMYLPLFEMKGGF